MKLNTKTFLFLILFSVFLVIPCVYATDEDAVNVLEFPDRLSEMMGIPLLAGQILASSIIIGLFTLAAAFTKNMMATVIMSLLSSTLCVALGWLPIWILLGFSMIIGLMFSGKTRDWLSGRS